MTTDDPIDKVTRALRESNTSAADMGESTWRRISRDHVARRARWRRLRLVIALQLAGLCVVVGAWAGVTGRLSRLLRPRPATESTASPPRIVPRRPAAAESPLAPARPRAPAYRRAAKTAGPPAAVVSPPPEGSIEPAPFVPPDEDALYRAGHAAHFARRDYAAALDAWDRYLRAAPTGRLALEVRFNRAVALSRLGRHDDAAAALEPFADGEYGSYRQKEAAALLSEINLPAQSAP